MSAVPRDPQQPEGAPARKPGRPPTSKSGVSNPVQGVDGGPANKRADPADLGLDPSMVKAPGDADLTLEAAAAVTAAAVRVDNPWLKADLLEQATGCWRTYAVVCGAVNPFVQGE